MRLFVAIDIDAPARAALAMVQKRVTRALGVRGALRQTRPEQMHLTLAFIGNLDEGRAELVGEALTPPLPAAPYTLVLGGLGVFPVRGAPRVLWVGAVAGAHETIALQRLIVQRLRGIGIELEDREFHPHLTLGRWKTSTASDRRAVAAVSDTGEIARVRIGAAILYQSRLSPSGSEYTPLVTAALAG